MTKPVQLPALGSLLDHGHFSEIAPVERLLPTPPRFVFGPMPGEIAADYFSHARLSAVGVCTARNIVLSDGLLMRADGQILAAPELNVQPMHVAQALERFGMPEAGRPARVLDGPHALIVGPGYRIYGHWLAEILPKLGVLRAAGYDIDTLKFLVPADIPGFARAMLELLGIGAAQLVPFGGDAGDVLVPELLQSSFLHNGVRYAGILRETVRFWRQRVEARHGALAQGGYPKRLFVARRGGSRRLAERSSVEQAFADAGFAVVLPELMPLLEQWRMFADAEAIAGEYGSGLHGSLFAEPGTVVCGLHGSSFHPAFIQSGMGEVLGQPTGYVFGVNEDDKTYAFGVHMRDVRMCLSSVFSADDAVTVLPAGVAAAGPMTADDYVAAHDQHVEDGQWDAALKAIRQAVALAPDLAGVHARRARLLARSGAPGALPAIIRAIEGGEISAENFALKAELLLRNGRAAPAVDAARQAVAADPARFAFHDVLARALLQAGRPAEAVQAAREAVARAPAEALPYLTLFETLMELGALDEAEAVIRGVYARAPRLPGAAGGLGRLLARKGEVQAAVAVALNALGEDPSRPELRAVLSAALPLVMRRDPDADGDGVTARPDDAAIPVARDEVFIDFAAGGNSAAHRLTGWSQQEPKYVWSLRESSALALPALDARRDWRAMLNVSACLMPPRVTKQRLRVEVDGVVLGERDITRGCMMPVLIPNELLRRGRPLAMRFAHPDFVVPRDHGASKDPRPLAICFHGIRLTPVSTRT